MQTYDFVSGQIIGPVEKDGRYVLTSEAQAALAERDTEITALIKKAADFIGTDEELQSIACVEVALDHAARLRRNWHDSLKQIDRLKAEKERLRKLYDELIMEVAIKLPYESRHETARRYIREREISDCSPKQAGKDVIKEFSRHLSHIPGEFELDEHGRHKRKDGRWEIVFYFQENAAYQKVRSHFNEGRNPR
jgi:hypothetical protein